MVDHVGWRAACAAYAVIHLADHATALLVRSAVGRDEARFDEEDRRRRRDTGHPESPDHRTVFLLLAAALTLAARDRDRDLDPPSHHPSGAWHGSGGRGRPRHASWSGTGRSARAGDPDRTEAVHPVWSLVASTVLVAVGLGMLVGSARRDRQWGSCSTARAAASGRSRSGTVPLAVFGRDGYAVLMGRLAMPTLVAQAASPFLGAVLLDRFGTTATLGVFSVCSR